MTSWAVANRSCPRKNTFDLISSIFPEYLPSIQKSSGDFFHQRGCLCILQSVITNFLINISNYFVNSIFRSDAIPHQNSRSQTSYYQEAYSLFWIYHFPILFDVLLVWYGKDLVFPEDWSFSITLDLSKCFLGSPAVSSSCPYWMTHTKHSVWEVNEKGKWAI